MSDDAVQLEKRICFALRILGESKSHHEFEAQRLGTARRRITSNLLPATGAVKAAGTKAGTPKATGATFTGSRPARPCSRTWPPPSGW
ncbi:hypothetical protein [Streptomyces sp. Tu 4128]|uniref:hypothetical protein n=1 Tax=Streptomyces sp. Tu 4128 TaxID=1120314 RepID=UPI0013CEA5A7|nr:hypothetical protein [Streptomyces sp. Tu 4128]